MVYCFDSQSKPTDFCLSLISLLLRYDMGTCYITQAFLCINQQFLTRRILPPVVYSQRLEMSGNIYILFKFVFISLGVCSVLVADTVFSGCGEQGLSASVLHGCLIVVAFLVAELGLEGCCASGVVVHRLCCPWTCGIFEGSDPCPLHWQADA